MNEVRNMKIDLQGIADRNPWEAKGYRLPQYDIVQMKKATQENPLWVHFGAGNLFRAFHAAIAQRMLNDGRLDRGIIVAEGFDYEIIDRVYAAHDNLGIAVTLKADGTVDKEVIGSVAEALPLDSGNPAAYTRLKEIFTKDSLQMITFTITEKGYCLTDAKGEYLPEVMADFATTRKTCKLYGKGGSAAPCAVLCRRKTGCNGQHRQLRPQWGQAARGCPGLREGMGGKQKGRCGISGIY